MTDITRAAAGLLDAVERRDAAATAAAFDALSRASVPRAAGVVNVPFPAAAIREANWPWVSRTCAILVGDVLVADRPPCPRPVLALYERPADPGDLGGIRGRLEDIAGQVREKSRTPEASAGRS